MAETPSRLPQDATAAVAMVDRGRRGSRTLPSTSRRATFGWAALTETEILVARLIASGRTNRSAAGDLHVSIHTVSTHVRSIFTKLDLHSRVELANAWHEHRMAG